MKKDYKIGLYLDTRRKLANGKYPLKIRVYSSIEKKKQLYNTELELTEADFEKSWNTVKPRNTHKELRMKLQGIETRVDEIAAGIHPFSFDIFERRMRLRRGNASDLIFHYNDIIESLRNQDRVGTASSYQLSLKSIIRYATFENGTTPKTISLYSVNPEWLTKYEKFLVKEEEKSIATVGIYTRALRAVFNKAIKEANIEEEYYPFGKSNYQIPSPSKVKKALNKAELAALYNAVPQNEAQERAKDFWFFSFVCHGVNLKDIALMRFENIDKEKLTFIREKSKRTSKTNSLPVVVYLTDYHKNIIKKYANEQTSSKRLVFPIVDEHASAQNQRKAIQNFNRSINQNIQRLAKSVGIEHDISYNWARHSFATNSIRNGASQEFMKEALGHKNKTTTENYFAGFEDEAKKEFAKNILNFE